MSTEEFQMKFHRGQFSNGTFQMQGIFNGTGFDQAVFCKFVQAGWTDLACRAARDPFRDDSPRLKSRSMSDSNPYLEGRKGGKERNGTERKGKERKGKERKGKERKGKERKGKGREGRDGKETGKEWKE
jgi:hypothetical protein